MSFLQTRYLRLPMWAWILILGVAFGAVYRLRSKGGGGDTTDGTEDPQDANGDGVVDPMEAAVGGDAVTSGGYDPSGMSGYPSYATQGAAVSGGGTADGGGGDNTNPALIDAIVAQNQMFADLFGDLHRACGPGTHWDDDSGRCVPDKVTPTTTTTGGSTTTGGGGTTGSTGGGTGGTTTTHKKPVPKCASGQRYDFLRGTCTKCPAGQTYDAAKKHCRAMTHAESVHSLSIQKGYAV